jgi:hypothetical protein
MTLTHRTTGPRVPRILHDRKKKKKKKKKKNIKTRVVEETCGSKTTL